MCEGVLLFSFLIIFFLHVHVKYIVVTSPTSSCSHKPQILYHCCCHVCLAQWCFLPSPPAHIMFAIIIILFTGYGPIKTASDDLSLKISSWWGMTFMMESGITPWLTRLWHNSTGCLCSGGVGVHCAVFAFLQPSLRPALQHSSVCLMLRTKSGTRPLNNKRLLCHIALRWARQLGYNLSV